MIDLIIINQCGLERKLLIEKIKRKIINFLDKVY